MRRIKDILEQHAEKGRFKPTTPRYVSSTSVVSPRPASDSANVKLKEDGGLAQNTLLVKNKKPMSTATAEISFQSVKEVAEVGDDPTNQGTPEGLVKRGNRTVLKKFKELTELVAPEAKDDIKSLDSMSFLKKHGLTKTKVKERLSNEEVEQIEEVRKMASGGRDNAGGQYYDIDNDDGTIGFGYKPGKSHPSSSHSNYEYKPEPKHPLHGKLVTAKHSNGQEVTGRMMGTEHQGTVAKIKHSSGMIHSTDAKTVKKANSGMKEDIERIEEMDKEQTPPGRDGGYQFAPGPKVSKKDIKAVKKNPAKHLSDLFAKEYAKKKMKEEVVDEAKDPKEYGYEGDMAMNQLQTIMRHAEYLMDMMKPDTDLPEWVQSKITLATDYLQTSCDYMTSEMKEEVKTPPFAGPYKKPVGTVKDKSGAVHTPMSRAKDLAKKAAMRQSGMKKESIQESRRADIIREAMKAAKEKVKKEKQTADEDKFVADPELNSKVIKTASQM